jgi:hypothetical protein
MEKENYKGIKHVVRISTNYSDKCEHCNESFLEGSFAPAINHYIEKHDYKLLHIGTETEYFEGNNHFWSVAILGK